MLLNNPIRENQQNTITERENKLYWGNYELKEVTSEQKKLTKTGANYYFENDRNLNDNNFFCHLDKQKGKFWIAETFNESVHNVWLQNNERINFRGDKIVLINQNQSVVINYKNESDALKEIAMQYNEIKNKKINVLFTDPLKDELNNQIYLQKIGDRWSRFGQELSPLTDQQKKISKTGANYALVDDLGTFLFHIDETNKKFTLAETINDIGHEVWLKDKSSMSFHNDRVVLRNNLKPTVVFNDNENQDFTKSIADTYSQFGKSPEVSPNESKEKNQDLGNVKKLNDNKFLKLGTAAGMLAMPLEFATKITGKIVVLAETLHQKVKEKLDQNIDIIAKNKFEVKSSISKLRKDKLESAEKNNKHTL